MVLNQYSNSPFIKAPSFFFQGMVPGAGVSYEVAMIHQTFQVPKMEVPSPF